MPSIADLKRMIDELGEGVEAMNELVESMKTESGHHLSNFGDDFVMLCRKYGIKQSVVARALDVTPTSVNRRYMRKLTRTDFFYPRDPE